ncbi:MAG: DNA-processing protein DprA [Lachnospiraceae bacterium]|nr:DNA-processing protein DprA [Lachnospiraceae bacterium]
MVSKMEKEELDVREYELACRHFLMHVNGIGTTTAIKIVDYYGSARRIWELEEKEIWQDQKMSSRQKSNLIERRKRWDMEIEWQKLGEKGIKVVSCDERIYPGKLREIPNKPFLLYYRGRLPEETKPCVAVIGARMCSEYGRSAAAEFAAGLAERGIQVVSGMADGIDGIAQRSALEHGGMSYGVLGCGVDICYPLSNRKLYQALLAHGGIISEFLPGTKPEAGHFPLRNRIISGLADLILVIEAKERSGTRITVNMALEQGREVYAVPGRITDELSRGCHRMICDGAGMALDIGEIAEAAELAWERNCCLDWGNQKEDKETPSGKESGKEEKERKGTEERKAEKETKGAEEGKENAKKDIEERILQLLRKKGMNADEILNCLLAQRREAEDAVNISTVQRTLSKLIFMGKAVCHGGLYEVRNCHLG